MIEELAPGVRAVHVPSPYDVHRHTTDQRAAILVSSGLFLRTHARPGTPVARFQPDRQLGAPENSRPLGWLLRVDIKVRSGRATLGYTTDDGRTIRGEQALDSHTYRVDLLLDHSAGDAEIVLRAGADVPAELIIRGFACYCLLDDDSGILDLPAGAALKPMPRWARFFAKPAPGLASRVRHLRFSRLAEPTPMRWLQGLELVLVPEEQTSRAVYVSGVYEPCTTSVLRTLLGDGNTCVDVGANIGLVTLLASRWVGPAGRVIAFEPSAREFARLRQHIERNTIANVHAVQSAVGNRDGTATLHVAEPNKAGHNTLEERFVSPNVTKVSTETVPLIRLDDYVSVNGIAKVDVIKIDVEGSEHQVIEGAQQSIARDRPALLIEVATASDPRGRLAIESSLRQLGYVFVAIDGDSGSLRHVADLSSRAENFLAALPDIVEAVHREFPVAGWRPRSSSIIAGPMESGNETPYVSIVLTGRNGGFGGDFNQGLFRTLEFNHAQLNARGIRHEFIFVEWRPEPGAPWLAELLADRFTSLVPETLRFVVVDGAYHEALSLNPKLQFQEFIAKNVGIRRSRGVFALTTNPGIVLSRGVLDLMEQRLLQPRVLYRAARVDLRKDLDGYRTDWSLLEDERNHEQINRIEPPIYSNAAGDFLLLDRESCLELRGFNEVYRVADAHVDRNFCVKALSSGLTLTPLDAPVYRLAAAPFNNRMAGAANRFAEPDWSERRWRGAVLYDNDADWGLGRAPVRRVRAGLDFLEFSWAAVPPAVSLRRIVLPVARQRAAQSPGVEWRPEMDRSPYPVTITHRDAASSGASDRTDQRVSHHGPADAIDRARLEFLATLDLPLQGKRVLDAGCGVGHHTPFYTSRGCHVVGIDGRPENIEEMRQRYPQVEGIVGDLQTLDLEALGSFDVVHCLGLLYQLDSPVEVLRRLASVCCGQLLLETIVCDADRPVMLLDDEAGSADQALAGLGCRPSPSFVAMTLDRLGFPYVYGTTMPPQHVDFQFEWRNNFDTCRDGANLRCVFVASHTPIVCDHLTLLIPGAGSLRG